MVVISMSSFSSKFIESSESSVDEEEKKDESEPALIPGVSFWIVVDWPNYALSSYEEIITKTFLAAGLNLESCKAIRSRGTFYIERYSRFC